MSRPQSAHPGNAEVSAGQLKDSGKKRQNSPTQTAMRSSFYSMSILNDDERAELEQEEFPKRYHEEQ